MKASVVYDSVFGNTEQVAQAIANALGPREGVEILRVSDVKPERLTGVRLLIADQSSLVVHLAAREDLVLGADPGVVRVVVGEPGGAVALRAGVRMTGQEV